MYRAPFWYTSILIGVFGILGPSCGNKDLPLRIAAAANTRYVVDSLVSAYSYLTGIAPEVVIASSGKLTAQIRQGAPYDVMLSADLEYARDLVAAGLTDGGVVHYCTGQLVLWSLTELDEPLQNQLLRSRQIAIANPELAPYGRAAMDVLKRNELLDAVEDKLVYGESISQVNQFVLSGAADVGFTSKSVVLSSAARHRGHWSLIDDQTYDPLLQGLVVIKNGNELLAHDFANFLKGDIAEDIFKSFGYLLPE